MTFLEVINSTDLSGLKARIKKTTTEMVQQVLAKDKIDFDDYLTLLSEAAADQIESLAVRAQRLTQEHFGKTILLFAPLYLNNECDNHCAYCGFSQSLPGERKSLSVEEVVQEAEFIFERGIRHLLLVAGEKRDKITQKYLSEVVSRLHQRFESIAIEIFPLEEKEYAELFQVGVEALTLYQEAYNPAVYKKYHPSGPKADYQFRLLAPERAGKAGYFRINIGTLLGLGEWGEEAALLGLHANYLKKNFWRTKIAVSFPRLQDSAAKFKTPHPVSDRQLVQMLCALRIFLPTVGLVLSTRESQELRDNLIDLGITQMSAESKTSPGGYLAPALAEEQFEVADKRKIEQIMAAIALKGYDPVFKDWEKTL